MGVALNRQCRARSTFAHYGLFLGPPVVLTARDLSVVIGTEQVYLCYAAL